MEEVFNWPTVRLVTDAELESGVFVTDVKTFASRLRIPRRRFVDWLTDGYRDAEVYIVDEEGNPVDLDFEALEEEDGDEVRNRIEDWLKDWLKRPERHFTPRLRVEARERVRLVATLLRAIFPKESVVWGMRMPELLVDRNITV